MLAKEWEKNSLNIQDPTISVMFIGNQWSEHIGTSLLKWERSCCTFYHSCFVVLFGFFETICTTIRCAVPTHLPGNSISWQFLVGPEIAKSSETVQAAVQYCHRDPVTKQNQWSALPVSGRDAIQHLPSPSRMTTDTLELWKKAMSYSANNYSLERKILTDRWSWDRLNSWP